MMRAIFSRNNDNNTKRTLLITLIYGLLLVIILVFFVIHLTVKHRNIEAVTKAAQKQYSHAQVGDVRVADGFAKAGVHDPTQGGQIKAGFVSYFKLNNDGSAQQIAYGSYIDPISLLGLGIPLKSQAKLDDININQAKQNLADSCGYNNGDTPGYSGFEGSFKPNGWGFDASKLFYTKKALDSTVSNTNHKAQLGDKVVCVDAVINNSNLTIDKDLQNINYTLQLKFITYNGNISTHKFAFTIDKNNSWSFSLDGQQI